MTKTQRYLAGLLLIQAVLIVLVKSPLTGSTGSSELHPLLPQLETLDATRIEFVGQDGSALNVVRSDGNWSVVEAAQFPADGSKISDLLDELTKIKVRRPVVASDRYHKTFKVTESDNEGRLRVWGGDDADQAAVELILGTSSNYMLNHVRVAGDDRVFEVQGLAPYDVRADADDWIQKSLLDVPADGVVGLTLTNPAGSVEIALREGQWKLVAPAELADLPLDQSRVTELIRVVRTLRIESPAGVLDEQLQGLAEPAATVTLRFSAPDAAADTPPQEVVVRLGTRLPDDETQRFVTRSGLPFAATVWDSSVKDLIEKTAADLLSSADESSVDS